MALQCGIQPQNGVFISRIDGKDMISENETQFWDKVWNMTGLFKKSSMFPNDRVIFILDGNVENLYNMETEFSQNLTMKCSGENKWEVLTDQYRSPV